MYRRYRNHRKSNGHALPITAISLVVLALLGWGIFSKGQDIMNYFKGKTIYYASDKEANDNLEKLLADLAGDKAKVLELAQNSRTRLGWIKSDVTRRRFRWILLTRLVDLDLWNEAMLILPEVESLATPEGLDRLARAARDHKDYELQLRLDRRIMDHATRHPKNTELLLSAIRRTAESCLMMNDKDEAVKAIARLDAPAVQARLTTPEFAREAAALQMIRMEAGQVKEPVLQTVRSILEKAHWPTCPATARLMLEEVSNTMRDNPNLTEVRMKELVEKLLRCRDSLLEFPDRDHCLPKCYMLLGELRSRLKDYEGCAQSLNLATAFAEGYGEMDREMQLKVARVRSRANEARGATAEAMADCRFLAEHEQDTAEVLRCLSFLAANTEGEEQIKLLERSWELVNTAPKGVPDLPTLRASIAEQLAAYYTEKESYRNAIRWQDECTKMVVESNPDLSTGKAFRARMQLALLYRKTKEDDTAAFRRLRAIMSEIDAMDEETRARLTAADESLYRTVVRELARTCLLMGDKSTAKSYCKKARIGLPERVR
ncbi:MAG: hypothetical protein ACI4OZ_04545 [Akkermansia sp.]